MYSRVILDLSELPEVIHVDGLHLAFSWEFPQAMGIFPIPRPRSVPG